MDTRTSYKGKSYFGITALLTGIVSVLFLGANFGASQLEITPAQFSQLNTWTALFYCISTPLAFALGVVGMIRKADSKLLAGMAMVLVAIPFALLFIQLVSSFLR